MIVSKVGILTFHRCINYGSYWQARCLAEGLSNMVSDVSILDHDSKKINMAEWKCAFQPVLPTRVPATDYPLYRKKIKSFFRAFESLPLSKRFHIDKPYEMDDYDMVVVGSDEVWNLFHPWYGKKSIFYGSEVKTHRLISYAATFGNYSSEWGLEPYWVQKLRMFEHISVRDENSRKLIFNALQQDPPLVLDPCLQFSVRAERRDFRFKSQKYVAVYGHNFSQSFILKIQQWARRRGFPLVSIGYRNDWADENWIDADPHDFANFVEGSEAVVTNFFHGCVFALRNENSFVC